jgi:hypothetical protein
MMPAHHADDGGNKARSPGRARSKPLKPLRGEGRIDPTSPVVTNSCAYLVAREAAGAAGTRSSLRPHLRVAPRSLFFQRRKVHASLGRIRSREREAVSTIPLRPILRDARERAPQDEVVMLGARCSSTAPHGEEALWRRLRTKLRFA